MSGPQTLLVAAACLAAVYGAAEIPSRVFPADSELIYNYLAHVSAGVAEPQEFLSHYSLQGKLRVQSAGEKVKLRLEDVLFSTYNGKGTKQKLPNGDFVSIPAPQDAKAISKPFVAIFNNGKIASFEYETSDTLWSRNMKRSLVSQFQIDLKEFSFDVPRVFTSSETGVSGECRVENAIVYGGKPDTYTLRKSQDASRCQGPKYSHESLFSSSCSASAEQKDSVSTSTERNYHLQVEKNSVIIKKIRSRSVSSFQPLWIAGELQYIFINQTLEMESKGDIPVHLVVGDTTPSTLTFEFQDSASGSGPDMLFERYSLPLNELVDLSQKSLVKLAEKLSEVPEADVTKLHDTNAHHLIAFLRHLDYNGIKKVADFALLGTSYKDESISQLFLSYLPKVGTQASVILIRDLITQKKLNEMQSLIVLADVPFYLRYSTPNLLKECNEFLNLGSDVSPTVRKTALLAFASMVGKICQSGACPPAILDEYVKIFFGRLRSATEYEEQMLYLQAMGNIKIGPVVPYLESILTGKLAYPRQLRLQAVWATADEFINNEAKASAIYWPMLTDRKNHLELRCAALTILLKSQPTTERFMNILWYMVSDPDYQLYQYFYSTIKSLANSHFPCLSKPTRAAQQIIKMVPKPTKEASLLTTSNEILDFVDPDLDVGQMHQLIMIGSEKSDMSDIVFLHSNNYKQGRVHNQFSIFLRTEGFNEIIAKNAITPEDDVSTSEKLKKLFDALKIKPRTSDPMHVEFVLKFQDRTVGCYYANETGISDLSKIFTNMQQLATAQHINYQTIFQAVFEESIFPSDLGTPITIEVNALPELSLRGNLSYNFKAPILAINAVLDTKISVRQGYGMRTFNPVSALWYGVHRPSVRVIASPMSTGLSLDLLKKVLKIRFGWAQNTSLFTEISHGRSRTFVIGSPQFLTSVLPQTCPDCSQFAKVVSPKEPKTKELFKVEVPLTDIELQASKFDCDGKVAAPYIKPLFMMPFSNYGISDDWSDYLEMLALQIDTYVALDPLINSCGRQFRVAPVSETSGVEFVLKSESSKGSKKLYRFLVNYLKVNGEVGKTYDTSVIAEPKEDETKFTMKVRMVNKQEGQPTTVYCLKIDNTYPERGPETYWAQLGQPFESRRTEHRLVLEFGSNAEEKCPAGGASLEVVATTEHQGLDDSVWPFNVCEDQRQKQKFANDNGELLYPATHACAMSSWGPRPRNVSISISANNVPAVSSLHKQLSAIGLLKTNEKESHKFQIETAPAESEDEMSVKLRFYDGNGKDFKIPMYGSKAYYMSEILATYPAWDNVQMAMGFIHPCLVAGGRVMTFDNASLPFAAQDKFTLISGICIENSPFAVFAKKSANSPALTVKVFIDGSEINIEPSRGQRSKVSIDGVEITKDVKMENFRIDQKENGRVNIKHTEKNFLVQNSDINLAVLVESMYDRYYCGICGDSNAVPEYQDTLGPGDNVISVDDMITSYTLA